ncbi:hypothetical protein ABK905_02355 [Acerihabitans sp. KWT182]|uniref:Uncharacterized protein n=1 Tax=Acerihabitans sp. KWT182 TaxID=3157919 RepID=A0AAU7QAP9_9GAMM
MHIYSKPNENSDIPVANRTFLSGCKRGIGTCIQRISNSPLWRAPTCQASFIGGALVSLAAAIGAKCISLSVDDINDLLLRCEKVSSKTYFAVMASGLKYGLSGGAITGLALAALFERYRERDLAENVICKLTMGAALGLSFGGIIGTLYAINLQHVHNVDDIHFSCYVEPLFIDRYDIDM